MHVFSNLSALRRLDQWTRSEMWCTMAVTGWLAAWLDGLDGWCCLSAIYPHLNRIRHQWVKFFYYQI